MFLELHSATPQLLFRCQIHQRLRICGRISHLRRFWLKFKPTGEMSQVWLLDFLVWLDAGYHLFNRHLRLHVLWLQLTCRLFICFRFLLKRNGHWLLEHAKWSGRPITQLLKGIALDLRDLWKVHILLNWKIFLLPWLIHLRHLNKFFLASLHTFLLLFYLMGLLLLRLVQLIILVGLFLCWSFRYADVNQFMLS